MDFISLAILLALGLVTFWGVAIFFLGAPRSASTWLMLIGAAVAWLAPLFGLIARPLFPGLVSEIGFLTGLDFRDFLVFFFFDGLLVLLGGFTWQAFRIVAAFRRAAELECEAAQLTVHLAIRHSSAAPASGAS